MLALEDWDVQDDLLLREAVEQGASLAALAAGAVRSCRATASCAPLTLVRHAAQVRFSRNFTEEEVTARWRALLYDKRLSRPAAIRMGKAEDVQRPPPPIGDDMETIVAAWRSARAAAAGDAAAPVDPSEPPTFSEVRFGRACVRPSRSRLTAAGAGGGCAAGPGPAQPAARPQLAPERA